MTGLWERRHTGPQPALALAASASPIQPPASRSPLPGWHRVGVEVKRPLSTPTTPTGILQHWDGGPGGPGVWQSVGGGVGRCAPSRGAAFTSSHCRTDLRWLTLGSFLSLPGITKQPSFSVAASPRPEILTLKLSTLIPLSSRVESKATGMHVCALWTLICWCLKVTVS